MIGVTVDSAFWKATRQLIAFCFEEHALGMYFASRHARSECDQTAILVKIKSLLSCLFAVGIRPKALPCSEAVIAVYIGKTPLGVVLCPRYYVILEMFP